MAAQPVTVPDMSKQPADPDAEKIAFRISGKDNRRTKSLRDYVMRDAPSTFMDELLENQSVLWRAVYRAGLDALEDQQRRQAEETPKRSGTAAHDLSGDKAADEARKARGGARKKRGEDS